MNSLGDQEDLRLRFDVPTESKQPGFHRPWIQRDGLCTLQGVSPPATEGPGPPGPSDWVGSRTARTFAALSPIDKGVAALIETMFTIMNARAPAGAVRKRQ